MVLSFRHQLEKTGKKMEKSGKNRYILTLARAFIFINILAILVESEHEQARDKIYIYAGVKFTHTPLKTTCVYTPIYEQSFVHSPHTPRAIRKSDYKVALNSL